MLHGTLTVVTRVQPSRVETLEALLKDVDQRIREGQAHPFEQVEGLYFGRWGILSPGPDGERLLVLGLDFSTGDGRYRKQVKAFLARWVDTLAEHPPEPRAQAFDAIYRCCEGYPTQGLCEPTRVREFLQASSVHYTARHVDFAYRTESVSGMRQLLALSEDTERYLNTSSRRLERIARDSEHWADRARGELRDHVPAVRASAVDPEWRERRERARRSAAWSTVLYPPLRYLVAFPTVGLFTALGWVEKRVRGLLRHLSPGSTDASGSPSAEPRYRRDPQGPVQNPMIHVATLEPGWGNRVALWMTLRSVNLRLKRYVVGLNHIRSIHCARWVLLKTPRPGKGALFRPKTRRLLFFSNYDGSWESYIDSFIDDPEIRAFLVEIWKGSEDFPSRRRGRPFLEPFKAWIHQKQVHTSVWYSAHLHSPEGRVEPAITDLHHVLRLRKLLASSDTSQTAEEELRSFLSRGVFASEPPLLGTRELLSYIRPRRKAHAESRAFTRTGAPASPPAPGRHPGPRAPWVQEHERRLFPVPEDRGSRSSPEVVAGDTP